MIGLNLFSPLRHFGALLTLLLTVFSAGAYGQSAQPVEEVVSQQIDSQDEDKEAKLPLSADREIELELDEVTWLSLDVATDGQRMVIEVLGDLYELATTGGEARQITQGMAFDSQPSFSPDGQSIAFVSDRDGSDDLWVLEPGSDEPRKISKTSGLVDLVSPSWSPDGQHIVVSQSSWSLRTYELWVYPLEGGSGVRITKAQAKSNTPNSQRHNALGAVYDPTGRYLYYATKKGGFGYNLAFPSWQIARRDLTTGTQDIITGALGSGIRPKLSPDGQWLVYGTRHKQRTGLRIRNLASGHEEWLAYPIQRDEQESRFTRDLLPGYAFAPDSKSLFTTRGGKVVEVSLVDKSVSQIPFSVNAKVAVHERLEFSNRVGLGPVKARVLAEPKLSPDGKQVAFASLSRIYLHTLASGKTEAISPADLSAGMPSWSPDGKTLVYAGWSLGEGGLYRQRARSGARANKISQTNGYYSFPVWAPDGKRIVALRGLADLAREREYGWGQTVGADVIWFDAKGGEAQVVMPARGYSTPHFGPESDRIYLHIAGLFPSNYTSGLISVRFDGTDRREHLASKGMGIYSAGDKGNAEHMAISPSGEHVLIKHASQLYVAKPVPHLKSQTVSLTKASVPLTKLTDVGADFASWSADGKTLVWSAGDHIYLREVASIEFLEANEDKDTDQNEALLEDHEAVTPHQVDVYLPRAKPSQKVALVGARILTMTAEGVIEDGTVLVEGNRILEVGARDEVTLPEDVEVIELKGQTLLPGFIDTHAHYRVSMQLYDRSEFSMLANLAYGVTTGMDVQPSSVDLLDAQDRIDAGLMMGPRAFSTGPGVFSNNDFKSEAHATAVLKRYKERYRVNNIKAYISGSRQQRQWLIQAAEKLKIMPTTEGALDMKLDITHAIDGFSGLEHAYPIPNLSRDVVQLTAQTRMAYTPTLLVNYGGPWAENWFYTNESPYLDPKLRRFMPYRSIAQRTLRKKWFHPAEYVTDRTAHSAHKVVAAGGQVGVGAHGQLQGLGYHWELWSLARGGFDNMDALRSATLMGAEMLGLAEDLGSIEAGKLADLVVLRENPLEDIRNTNTLSHVVANGVVYNADTLDQVWPEERPLPEQWWWVDEAEQLSNKVVSP